MSSYGALRFCLPLLLLLVPAIAAAGEIQRVRVAADASHTRIVLDLSGPVAFQWQQQADRLRLRITAAGLANSWQAPVPHGLLRSWSNQSQASGLGFLATLAPDARARVFALKPAGGFGDRLVIEVTPGSAAVGAPPSMADDKTAAATRAGAAAAAPVRHIAWRHARGMAATMDAAALLGAQRKLVVVIDAGHGGKDPGSHGKDGTLEKNVTLAVARDLAAAINRQPGMQAVLTRDRDVFIPLEQRFQIAREHAADLFVSIHADAYTDRDARGSSVWVLSSRGKTGEAARWLADRENSADLVGGVSLEGRSQSLAAVLLDLQQSYVLKASESIASRVLSQLASLGPTHRGYVERANFVVLRSPDVPSILVETAFISNPQEEQDLRKTSHQARLASAIMGGIRAYFLQTPPPGTWFAAQHAQPVIKPAAAKVVAEQTRISSVKQ